jgi:hypothetical protein
MLKENNELQKRNVEPFSDEDVKNMEFCVRLKIEQHPQLLEELLKTVETPIYEDVTKRGPKLTNLFWGAMRMPDGSWKGENTLGKIWEKIRKEKLSYYTEFSKEEIYAKFQTGKDPFEHLKKAYSEGEEIEILNLETMSWVEAWYPDWSLPISRYRVNYSH